MPDRDLVRVGVRVSLLGLPGAGKTTVARGIREALGWQVLNIGAALRQRSEQVPGLAADLAAGHLGPEALVITIIEETVRLSGSSGLIVDGFPRHPAQIAEADRLFGSWQPVLLEIAEADAVGRLERRAPEEHRAEDHPEVVRRRMAESSMRLHALICALRPRTILRIPANESEARVLASVLDAIRTFGH